ncbi:ExeM/NucH family extracellular endonuclease [Cellulomonas bogoriensis]|uniref:5'-nucleotidase n=1 Tax=Cellulomonas bogoriensis 69B4 = DSM 16987 TaxID=1386082 RepID=A0A0A0C1Z3_9CELL|nr:ExeM/NucH family extracellular endonuclease [Cellulomonas bogoriensis]KGM14196.1 5'-nucleotidase [Cellulomonas bogoriensis 69B4 = DSM 16987]
MTSHVRRTTPRLAALSALTTTALGLSVLVVPPALGATGPTPAAVQDASEATHTIAEVQGTGASTPLAGSTVAVEGVVTADHTTGGFRGLYVQTVGSGGQDTSTPGASDGIFVFLGNRTTDATIGDTVLVRGVAGEYFGLTQINASGQAASLTVTGQADLPDPVPLTDDVVGDEREQYESMLVTPQGDYRVVSSHEVDRYGALWLSAGAEMPVKGTEATRPGPEADAIATLNAARRILLDDGRSTQVTGATQPYLSPERRVRNGDGVEFDDLTYVLHYGFDEWRLQPTTPISDQSPASEIPTFTPLSPRPDGPPEVGGDLTVGAFNVLNYFTTLSQDDSRARGARTAAQLERQRAKIVAAITGLGADVVALQEVENSVHFGSGEPDVALQDLVGALNDAEGGEVWSHVPTPSALVGPDAPDTDVIMNAIIYRQDAVEPVGEARTQVDESVWDIAREPIAQTFVTADGPGSEFAVVTNHFKSKGGGSGAQPADGQGFFNAERVGQARGVLALVEDLAADGVEDVVVMGDLNAYSQEDPVVAFLDAGLVDLTAVHAPGSYTYTFDGELGSLDHALATPGFAERVTGAGVWDINSAEWYGFQYNGAAAEAEAGTVFRSSDHDPVLVGLRDEPADAGDTVEIDILGINDLHGRIEAAPPAAGVAVLAGAVDAFREQNPNTLFASAGDNIGASTFTSFVLGDKPTLDALNAMGLDVTSVGNHEFDLGRTDLDDRVIPASQFPHLGANVYDRATGEPAYDDHWITEVDGVRVGFIGAVTEDLPTLVSPAGIESLEIRSIVDEVNRVAADLTDGDESNGEADVLVLLVHEGPVTGDVADATDDSAFGQIATGVSPEVDVIFAGHTHRVHAHELPVDGWPEGLGRPVVQAGQYGEHLARVTLTVDRTTGDVVENAAEVLPLVVDGEPAYPADEEVAAIVAEAVELADEVGAQPLGQVTAGLARAQQANGQENRGGESTLGNLVADVQRWATQDAGTQIAFMNPGGLRADLPYTTGGEHPDGTITYRQAATVQPFANTLVTMELTGEQVVAVLEEQWQPEGSSRPFLKLGVSGLTYTYDPTAARGERITRVLVDGEPLDLQAGYTVVANSFLAAGGDNFATLAQGADVRDSGRVDLQAFVDYMDQMSPVSPDLAQRAVGVHLPDVPAGGAAPGATVTVELSSLLFSAGEPQGEVVALRVDGTEVATSPIDPSVVDGTDEVGRATLAFPVPQGAAEGGLEVEAFVESTGTTATFVVPVAQADAPDPADDPWLVAVVKKVFGWLWHLFIGWWRP